jgi:hypothetical protein
MSLILLCCLDRFPLVILEVLQQHCGTCPYHASHHTFILWKSWELSRPFMCFQSFSFFSNSCLWLTLSQSCLILKDPTNIPLLSQIYLGQQQRLQAIVDDLTEIKELSDVSG